MLGPALRGCERVELRSKWRRLRAPGMRARIAREAYGRGQRHFIAVGGDGTSYEVVNGLFPEAGGSRSDAGKTGEVPAHAGILAAGDGKFFSA